MCFKICIYEGNKASCDAIILFDGECFEIPLQLAIRLVKGCHCFSESFDMPDIAEHWYCLKINHASLGEYELQKHIQ